MSTAILEEQARALTEEEILTAYDRAMDAYGWFYLETLPESGEPHTVDGQQYYRVAYPGMENLADLQAYLQELETAGVLAAGTGVAEIDYAAQRTWLKGQGVAVESMSEQEILEADTGSHVFVALSGTILDAMEDFKTTLTIGGAA